MANGSRSGTLRISVVTDDRKAQQGLSNLNRKIGAFGAAAALAVAAFAGSSVKSFAEFDSAMTQSVAIAGDVSDSLRGDMSDAAREMAKTTVFSATQAAQSYFFLHSAGLDAEQAIAALPRVAAFAQAGMFDMARATDLLTDAQSALGLTVDDTQTNLENMTRVGDVLVKANTLANASVEEFATSLTTKAGAALRQHNIEVETGVAVLATFADQGLKGSQAGTILARTIEGIAQRAPQLDALGVSVFDAAGEMRNMADIVGDLETRLAGMSTEQRNAELASLGFNERTRQGLLLMLGNSEAIREYESELRNAGGTMDEIAGKQLETLSAQWGLLRSRMADMSLEIGSRLAPSLGTLVEFGIGLFDTFDGLDESMQTTLITAGLVSAAGVGVAGAFVAIRAAAQALGIELLKMQAKAGLIGLAFAGIGAAIGHVIGQQQEYKGKVEELGDTLDGFTGAINDNTRAWIRKELMQSGAAEAAARLGLDVQTVVDALAGEDAAMREVTDTLGGYTDRSISAAERTGDMRGAIDEAAKDADLLGSTMRELGGALEDAVENGFKPMVGEGLNLRDTMDQAEHETHLAAVAAERMEGAARAAGAEIGEAASTVDDYTESMGEAESALRSFADELRAQTDPVFALIRAEERLNEVLDDTEASSLDAAAAAIDYMGAVADAEGVLNNRFDPALRDVLRSLGLTDAELGEVASSMQGATGRASDLAAGLAPLEGAARDAARGVQDLDGHLRRIPREVRVNLAFSSTGFPTVRQQIQQVQGAQFGRYLHDGGYLTAHDGLHVSGGDGARMLRPDEVPIIAQTGELVLSRLDVALLQEAFRNLPRAHGGGEIVAGGVRKAPALAAAAAGSDREPVVLEIRSSGSQVDDMLVEILRKAVRVRGGDVQVVLGRGRS